MPNSFADEVEKLSPAVVNVSAKQNVKMSRSAMEKFGLPPGIEFDPFLNKKLQGQEIIPKIEQESTSLGSGFIIDPSGIIVTNNISIVATVCINRPPVKVLATPIQGSNPIQRTIYVILSKKSVMISATGGCVSVSSNIHNVAASKCYTIAIFLKAGWS
jgi:hypothetical protein